MLAVEASCRQRRPGLPFGVIALVLADRVACRVADRRADSEGHADEDRGAEADSNENARTDADHPQAVAEPDADDEEADPDSPSDGQWSGPPRGVLLATRRVRLHRRPCADAVQNFGDR